LASPPSARSRNSCSLPPLEVPQTFPQFVVGARLGQLLAAALGLVHRLPQRLPPRMQRRRRLLFAQKNHHSDHHTTRCQHSPDQTSKTRVLAEGIRDPGPPEG
jgi:hypothetical protein